MRLDSEKLTQYLEKGLRHPLYVVVGEEPLLAFEALDSLGRAAHAAGYATREVLTVEPRFDWGRLTLAAGSSSLFGDKKILELRIPTGKPGVEGGRRLEAFARQLPQDTLTLISLPAMDARSQQSAWFKALEQAGLCLMAAAVDRIRLVPWISQRLARQHQQASPETLAFLAERVEGHLLAAFQEIQKLGLLFPPGTLPDEEVRNAVLDVARYDVADLPLSLLTGDRAQYVRTLRGLEAEGEALPLVLWAIADILRALAHVVTARHNGRPLSAALQEARVWGSRQALIERRIPHCPPGLAEACLVAAARVDRMVKGLDIGNPWDALLQLGMNFLDRTAA
jgi:DNA polymerase-3 subunit delta